MPNRPTTRLRTAQHERQTALFRAADLAAYHADRALAGLWQELLAVLRITGGFYADYARALAVLRRVGPVSATVLMRRLAGLYYAGHAGTVAALRTALPQPVREGRLWEDDASDPLAAFLFPAPSEESVFGWLAPLVRPADYALVGTDTDRRLPEDLARQVAVDMSLGKTQREVAQGLLPHLDGSRVRARRAARTLGLVAAHAGQREAWDQLGDMVGGYQIHATLDAHTRPEHRARDGTVYHVHPATGQKGLDELPYPPQEADGKIAWNCRCWITPVLRIE